jgi:predicted nucleic acid-binding protein
VSAYIDSSAAGKLLADEPESSSLAGHLLALHADDVDLVSSLLLETELRRIAVRDGIEQSAVSDVLALVSLVVPTRSLFFQAGVLQGQHLRSLDALHVATAILLRVESFISYDGRQCEAARAVGLTVGGPASETPSAS